MEQEARGSGCGYKKRRNMGCLWNPIIVSSSTLYNILYGIVK